MEDTTVTKKHFIALADAIRAHNAEATRTNGGNGEPFYADAVHTLADFCASQNPAFDRARWLAYIAGDCGPNGRKR